MLPKTSITNDFDLSTYKQNLKFSFFFCFFVFFFFALGQGLCFFVWHMLDAKVPADVGQQNLHFNFITLGNEFSGQLRIHIGRKVP